MAENCVKVQEDHGWCQRGKDFWGQRKVNSSERGLESRLELLVVAHRAERGRTRGTSLAITEEGKTGVSF
jgi:hypothetical protein